MGVRKLNKFLTTRGIIKTYRNIQEFIIELKKGDKSKNNSHNGKIIIAIDFWLYAHKFLHSNRSENILLGFWNQILKFFSYGIIPLYVMDGSVPIEKQEKVEERARKRLNYKKRIDDLDSEIEKYVNINDLVVIDFQSVNDNDNHSDDVAEQADENNNLDAMYEKKEKLQKHIKRIKTSELYNIHKLFDVLGVPYVKAEFEADALCAKLFKERIITSCLSDDMDMLALGCGSTIKFQDRKLIEFNMEQIKEELQFTQEQFIDMCIMFGCDYLQHPFRLECDEIYEMIKKHGSLLDSLCSNEHELFNMSNSNVKVIGEHYYQVKETYLSSYEKEYIPNNLLNLKMQQINIEDLMLFLKRLKWFDNSSKNLKIIEEDIERINHMIENDEL
jgi:5'-3' exonuclease